MGTFKAIRIDKAEKGTTAALAQFDEAELMDGDVTVAVEWSTLNYKDGLAVTGKAPVVRRFPMIAGIDFAGTVSQSSHPDWKAGDKVVVWFAAANRDPDHYPDPHRFDVGRNPSDNLTFGRGGPHHCLGAHLARLEVRVYLEELAKRVTRIEQAGAPVRLRSNFTNGLKRLPVRMTRA